MFTLQGFAACFFFFFFLSLYAFPPKGALGYEAGFAACDGVTWTFHAVQPLLTFRAYSVGRPKHTLDLHSHQANKDNPVAGNGKIAFRKLS